MKKVLILCYDFPPLTTVAAQRPWSWYEQLSNEGYKPIVICRQWHENIVNQQEKFSLSDLKEEHIINENKEVHKLLPPPSKRDAIIEKHGLKQRVFQRKLFTFYSSVASGFNIRNSEYRFILEYSEEYLRNNNVDLILATGSPFDLFRIAGYLAEKFNIPWIADYRDEWESNNSIADYKWFNRLLFKSLSVNERKCLSNAACFTTVSPPLIKRISNRIDKKGFLVRNGLDFNDLPSYNSNDNSEFKISYSGTIYNSGYIEHFVRAFLDFLKEVQDEKSRIKLQLIGIELNYTSGTEKFLKLLHSASGQVEILKAMSHRDALKILADSQLCLNLVPGNIANGIYTVKLYDYLALKKPVLNVESEKPLEKHEFFDFTVDCHTVLEIKTALLNFYGKWKKGEALENILPANVLNEFDRKYQCTKLAEVLKTVLSNAD